ncbi:C-type lectin domain family 10 member A [Amphibalanus amphitrite]|uniref:C-type lectin domain family 10 member A n=1 Tax=Amphibalanus amphitrite TaxID=1232801 RepID=A0A6A4WUP3_AMPAM|nr:C-type lectin domain family 10 member A [Amphibalanus amphitrite]
MTAASRVARIFLPRRQFTKTCVAVTAGSDDNSEALAQILEAINSSKDMLTAGQAAILQAIAGVSTGGGTGTCDLSGLEEGQTTIMNQLTTISMDLEQLDDIQALIESAKSMILAGQTALATSISDLGDDIDMAKTEILAGQSTIITDIAGVATDIDMAKTMLLNGQTTITTDIGTLSTDLGIAKQMILDAIAALSTDIDNISTLIDSLKTMVLEGQDAINNNIENLSTQITTLQTTLESELTDIDNQLDALEAGQQEICDKIEALDAKLDTILDKLMEGSMDMCDDGSEPINGQCFFLSQAAEDFEDARAACEAQGGTLATMTADNAAALYALADMASNDKVWIGLTAESGAWEWEDGTDYPSGFMDWDGGIEPSPASMRCGEAQATSSSDGFWNDITCNAQRQFICSTTP